MNCIRPLVLKSSVARAVVILFSIDGFAEPANTDTRQRAPFTVIVGHWTPVNDEGPAFKVDGERWGGTTDRPHLESMSRSLFGRIDTTFVANGMAPQAFPIAVAQDVGAFANGTLRVRFKLVGGKSDQIAGIMFGLRPTGEYYFMRYNTKDGNIALWRYARGERIRVAEGEAHKQIALNTWNELTVRIAGNVVTGMVGGTDLNLTHTFDAPVTGHVGVWVKRDAITTFKDFAAVR
jgi:hypothetical protein